MDPFVRRFIKSSLVWLATGVLLGLAMVLWPRLLIARPAHMHANLLGFVSMMIFGVAYHILPRFAGRRLRSPRNGMVHLWLANVGLGLMVGGWLLRPWSYAPGQLLLATGSVASVVGVALFIHNIWTTIGRAGVDARVGLSALQTGQIRRRAGEGPPGLDSPMPPAPGGGQG